MIYGNRDKKKSAECNPKAIPGPAELLRPERSTRRAANVLIVDDDVDSALLVKSIFNHLGCETVCTLDSIEARKRILSMKADIIILDWVLDRATDAKSMLKLCSRSLQKFGGGRKGHRPKIVTYSSLEASEIEALQSDFFDHLEHWKKPIGQRELLSRSLALLEKLGA